MNAAICSGERPMRSQVLRVRRATIDECPRRSAREFSSRLTRTLSVSMRGGATAAGSAGSDGGCEAPLAGTGGAGGAGVDRHCGDRRALDQPHRRA